MVTCKDRHETLLINRVEEELPSDDDVWGAGGKVMALGDNTLDHLAL